MGTVVPKAKKKQLARDCRPRSFCQLIANYRPIWPWTTKGSSRGLGVDTASRLRDLCEPRANPVPDSRAPRLKWGLSLAICEFTFKDSKGTANRTMTTSGIELTTPRGWGTNVYILPPAPTRPLKKKKHKRRRRARPSALRPSLAQRHLAATAAYPGAAICKQRET